MFSKNEIDQALIALAETTSQQVAIIRRHTTTIIQSMEAGTPMKEILSVLSSMTGVKIDLRWAYRILEAERKKANAAITPTKPAKPTIATSSASAIESVSRPVTTPASVTPPITPSTPPPASKPASGWHLEHQDDTLPPDLLKKAFAHIAGIKVDLRQPCPAEFGENHEEIKHQVNPSSPNWPEFRARAQARTTYAQDQSYWNREFKKWLITQGYTGAQY
jgi:hypothetical protein